MRSPRLIVVAGCNGSGKSTFSKTYVSNLIPFDYDKRFMQKYDTMQDSELRDVIAHNLTQTEFETAIYEAFSKRKSFCYETNFDAYPVSNMICKKGVDSNVSEAIQPVEKDALF